MIERGAPSIPERGELLRVPRCDGVHRSEAPRAAWRCPYARARARAAVRSCTLCGMDAIVGVAEARAAFADVLERASSGQRVLIARHGDLVAALVPLEDYRALRYRRRRQARAERAGEPAEEEDAPEGPAFSEPGRLERLADALLAGAEAEEPREADPT